MATQIGDTLTIGVGITIGTYYVESRDINDRDVRTEDINDEDGTLVTRIVLDKHDKVTLNLISQDDADPATDFPVGEISAATGFTDYYVESCVTSRTEGAARTTVSLINLGIT